MKIDRIIKIGTLALVLAGTGVAEAKSEMPNIVYIICDDLGYGDIHCLNPERGKIPTPHIDKLASEGMIFTDAHSGSSVCTPTRYGVLTGRYAWRTRLQSGVLGKATKDNTPLIAPDRTTIASLLKKAGYNTACIGKWHLGFLYVDENGDPVTPKESKWNSGIPVGTRAIGSPIEYGFDYFFGVHHAGSIKNIFRGDRVFKEVETVETLPFLCEEAEGFIKRQSKTDAPFFLYLPLTSPHSPIVPAPEWVGKSGIGPYGDFVMQTDDVVGQILQTLEENGKTDNTLVIFTSDNGCSARPSKASTLQRKHGHYSSAHLRGFKADGWEGGHRVPFIVRWPGKVKAGSTNPEIICLTSLLATGAEITGQTLADNEGEDSFSILPTLLGTAKKPIHDAVIHHTISGRFAIRQGKWKLGLYPGSGGWTAPRDKDAKAQGLPKIQLYDMEADVGETTNLADQHPEVVARLLVLLEKKVAEGRSTSGQSQKNDMEVDFLKDAK